MSTPLFLNSDLAAVESLVRRIMHVEDITIGGGAVHYLARYRGRLVDEDSAAAYDRLAKDLKPLGVTPLFRWDEQRHAVFIVSEPPKPKPANPWVNLALFLATLASLMLTGFLYGPEEALPSGVLNWVVEFFRRGLPFALAMTAILGAHEFGHYLMGRARGVHVTLPYFIPLPFSPFGTMGAFINMKEVPRNRRVLLDIGIAGPLAGMVVAVPVLYLGLRLSGLSALPAAPEAGIPMVMEGNSLLYLLLKYLSFGQLLPQPAGYGSLPPILYWLGYFFTSRPYPYGGVDVLLHDVAWAGWAGFLVTAMNLIPVGQLDGGHVLSTLVGEKTARRLAPVVIAVLAVLGFFWNGWWLWAVLIYFLSRARAEVLDEITPLDSRRRWLSALALLVFFLTFTPVPLS